MALVIKDRVKETTTTTGTGTFNLAGAVSGFEGFIQVGDGNTTYYVCTDNTDFEIGIGTFTDGSPDTLSRDTILQSSNSDNKVNWSAGTRTIFCTYPADKAVVEDASNNINGTFVGNITGDVTGNADTATTLETAREINGTSFNGSANITVTAAAGTLTGSTLNSGVTASSLTSLGTLASNLNLGGQDIVTTTSNQDIDLAAHGTGKVVIKGNTNQGAIKLNCEANSHGQTIIAAPHSESANNTLTLPSTGGDARLVSATSTATLTNKSLTAPILTGSSSSAGSILFKEDTDNGTNAVTLIGPASTADVTVTLPAATDTLVGKATTDTLTNKTIDVDNNTVSNIEVDNFKASAIVLESEGIGSNDNDTSLPTSAAVKDYVDTQITAEDLDLTTDSGTIAIDLDSETLTVTGGTGIDTSASGNEVTIAGSNASTSSKGIASFSDTFFSVSSGAVSLDAAQTGITSVVNTALEIGRDADNRIKFGTDNQIIFEVDGGDNVIFKTSGEIEASSLDISGNADIDGTLEADAITVNGTALNTVIAGVTVTNATTAAVATTVTISDNESTNEENAVVFTAGGDVDGGNIGLESDGDLTYNPSTGTISATVFKGNIDAVDGDFDGTLEADAITVGGTALNTVIAGVTVTNATNAAHVLVTDNESTNEENLITFVEGATSSTGNVGLEMDGNLTYNPSTGTISSTIFKGNIDAVDGDFDGTLEADAITLNGTAITTVATLSTGISNGNVLVANANVADNDFLRVDGTSIEGRSASQVVSDLGVTTASAAADEATALAIALG